MSTARIALVAARPFVAAAANTGGGVPAIKALQLIDAAIAELKPRDPRPAGPTPHQAAEAGEWEPEGGWKEARD